VAGWSAPKNSPSDAWTSSAPQQPAVVGREQDFELAHHGQPDREQQVESAARGGGGDLPHRANVAPEPRAGLMPDDELELLLR
jgi:hypothetical protein